MKNLSELIKKIEKSNKKFNSATKAEKRVMIAQDTIERVKANNLIIKRGNFLESSGLFFANEDASFKDFTNSNECTVCAKGALFCSFVGRVNAVTNLEAIRNNNWINDKPHQKLLEIFSKQQLDLIETAFEGCSYLKQSTEKQHERAKSYYYKYNDTNKRLIAICENIIKNKGTFKV